MDTSQLLGTLHPSSALDHSDGPTAPGGRQAIHLRLTEDLLQKLLGLGTTHKGELQIDLGSSPVSACPRGCDMLGWGLGVGGLVDC